MGLSHKWEKWLAVFCWLAPRYCSLWTRVFFLTTLNSAFFLHHISETDCDCFTIICVYLMSSLFFQSGSCIQTEMCLHVVCYLFKESVQKLLLLWIVHLPCQTNKTGSGSVTLLPQFLECFRLVYTAYSP